MYPWSPEWNLIGGFSFIVPASYRTCGFSDNTARSPSQGALLAPFLRTTPRSNSQAQRLTHGDELISSPKWVVPAHFYPGTIGSHKKPGG